MNQKKILSKAAFMVMFCTMLTATDRGDREGVQSVCTLQDAVQNEGCVSFQNFMRMTDQQIQNLREVVIPLSESYSSEPYSSKRDKKIYDLNSRLLINPNLTIILDCAGATCIENNCISVFYKMRNFKIMHAENVISIGNDFLYSCHNLITLDLSALSNVRNIGNDFLTNCSLTMIDLSPFSNLESIGRGFLSECQELVTLNLSPLSNVRNIGDHFLTDCGSLTMLDLSPLWKVSVIGKEFLSYCIGLTTLDLTPLLSVPEIGKGCILGCTGLKKESVTIPQNWRWECCLPENLRGIRDSKAPHAEDHTSD